MFKQNLGIRNLTRRPARFFGLTVLTTLLSLSIFGGTLFVLSLQRGLSSLQNRLGADIMVVPYEATTKADLSNILLQGNTGYFYMDESIYEKLKGMDGVGEISDQFFLSTVSASCCSVPVQIIGIDPATDFTIRPWLRESYGEELRTLDVVVGNDLNAFPGETLTFYNTEVNVVAKLKKTGTSLDTAVYTNEDTIKTLIKASLALHLNTFSEIDPDRVVSCVLINVADGYTVEDVLNDINIHVRKVEAVRTKNMISDVSESLGGVSRVIGLLILVIFVLSLAMLCIVFSLGIQERKKEFAVLRTLGASKKKVASVVMTEGFVVGALGSLLGILLSIVLLTAFSTLLSTALGLPFLFPPAGTVLLLAALSFAAVSVVAAGSNAAAGHGILSAETGYLLRE